MAKITRIKAKDEPKSSADKKETKTSAKAEVKKSVKKVEKLDPKAVKKAEKLAKKAEKAEKPTKNPIRLLARYIKHSWQEIRQVRWPSRGATWKMVFAVLIYTALLVAIITLLDVLFTFVFNKLLG